MRLKSLTRLSIHFSMAIWCRKNILQELAEKTGGRYFKGGDINTIRQSFIEVAEELRRQYVLGYEPKRT